MIYERRDDERDGDEVVIEMQGPPIIRCQSRFSYAVQCVKPPHGPDDQWHRNGAFEWHTDAEERPLTPEEEATIRVIEGDVRA